MYYLSHNIWRSYTIIKFIYCKRDTFYKLKKNDEVKERWGKKSTSLFMKFKRDYDMSTISIQIPEQEMI